MKKKGSYFIPILLISLFMILFNSCDTGKIARGPQINTTQSLDQAVNQMTNHLLSQIKKRRKWTLRSLKNFIQKKKDMIVVIPFFDVNSAEIPKISEHIEQLMIADMEKDFNAEKITFSNISKADYLLHGLIGIEKKPQKGGISKNGKYFVISAVIDMKTNEVIAKTKTWFTEKHIDYKSVKIDDESPVHLISRDFEATIKAITETEIGESVPEDYGKRVNVWGFLTSAINAYEEGRYPEAFQIFKRVSQTPSGKLLRTYAGLYLSAFKTGNFPEAEKAFSNLVELAMKEHNQIEVKILFNVDSVEFTGGTEVERQYEIWMRQLGLYFSKNKTDCIEIEGNCSKSGDALYNLRLSAKRARKVLEIMEGFFPEIKNRSKIVGNGFNNCVVCSGTDDDQDKIDRRVVFNIVDCDSNL